MDVLVAGGHGQIARRLLRLLAAAWPHRARADPQPRPRRRPRGRRRPPGAVRPRDRRRAPARRRRVRDRLRRRRRARKRRRAQADGRPRRRAEVHRGRAGARRAALPDGLLDGQPRTSTPTSPMYAVRAGQGDADEALEDSGLGWTIVRPGRLTDEPGTARVELAPAIRPPRRDPARRRRARALPLPARRQHAARSASTCSAAPTPAEAAVRAIAKR